MTQKEEKELLKFVREFRKGILGKGRPHGMCWAVAQPLRDYMEFCGYKDVHMQCADIMYKNTTCEHFYLLLPDGRILDPTASQFIAPDGSDMPEIYLGAKPEWYNVNPYPRTKTEREIDEHTITTKYRD